MKRAFTFLIILALVLIQAAPALARSAPANPMAPAPTATPTAEPTPVPTIDPNVTTAPSMPRDGGYDSGAGMLSEDMIAQLDEEVRDYLIGTGEMIARVEGIRNILLVGLDARPGETRSRSDTMVILTLDGNNNEIRLTSLLRDMYVSIPGQGNNRINAAWVYGGFESLRATIRENLGLEVDEYVAVDLTLLTDLLDQIGGLTLTVESQAQLRAINGVIDGYNYQFGLTPNSDFLTELGEQHMNGKQVQAYARYRKIDSDIKRTERQREVLQKIFEKLQSMSLIQLSQLAMTAMSRLETNLSLSDIIALIPVMYGMKDANFAQLSLPFAGEYQAKTVSGMAVLVPDLRAAQARLAAFVNG